MIVPPRTLRDVLNDVKGRAADGMLSAVRDTYKCVCVREWDGCGIDRTLEFLAGRAALCVQKERTSQLALCALCVCVCAHVRTRVSLLLPDSFLSLCLLFPFLFCLVRGARFSSSKQRKTCAVRSAHNAQATNLEYNFFFFSSASHSLSCPLVPAESWNYSAAGIISHPIASTFTFQCNARVQRQWHKLGLSFLLSLINSLHKSLQLLPPFTFTLSCC